MPNLLIPDQAAVLEVAGRPRTELAAALEAATSNSRQRLGTILLLRATFVPPGRRVQLPAINMCTAVLSRSAHIGAGRDRAFSPLGRRWRRPLWEPRHL